MKILFLSDNFSPETNAPAKRTLEHCKEWINLGHEITVITSVPNFPIGKVYKGYKNKLYQTEKISGITVKRVWTFIAENKGFFLRIIDYLSFMFSSMICGLFTKKNDMIIATSPQFFTLLSGYFISLLRRTPLIIEIRDMWPESIVAVGAMNEKSFVIRLLKKIANFIYKKSTVIVCVTNSFKEELINKGINESKIKVVQNGFDLSKLLTPTISVEEVEKKYSIRKDDLIVSFIGTIGMAHGLNIVLKAAKNLNDVKFLIIGEGAEKKELIKKANEDKIDNVIFIDNISWQEIVNINQLIDFHLIHLKKDPEFTKVIPSKIFESMALKKPIIMGVDGEAKSIVNQAKCSVNIRPENDDDLVKAIHYLNNNFDKSRKFGINGFDFLKKNFSRKILANKMIEYIKATI